jgi:hypothetical protein
MLDSGFPGRCPLLWRARMVGQTEGYVQRNNDFLRQIKYAAKCIRRLTPS